MIPHDRLFHDRGPAVSDPRPGAARHGRHHGHCRGAVSAPAVLILDEATRALDSGVEAGVMNTI